MLAPPKELVSPPRENPGSATDLHNPFIPNLTLDGHVTNTEQRLVAKSVSLSTQLDYTTVVFKS